ncbi:MAG: hypothetical protein B7Y93_04045 [Micrococcales bacterium 32-70-13]|nr:MAG: hypothetical protein B7Y93_04045 [Micrococcales bacterium 32-70-13]
MLHLVHPSLSRAAALDPHRLRQQALVVSATVVALGLMLNGTVSATLAAASDNAAVEPRSQVFIAAPEAATAPAQLVAAASAAATLSATAPVGPAAREPFTIDQRPPLVYPPGYGTTVVSMADGVVTLIGNPGSALGTHLEIEHVIDGQVVTSVYAHLVAGSIPLQVGDRVRVGDPVGLVGATGAVTGAHLHFELRVDGATINPVPWLQAYGAQ